MTVFIPWVVFAGGLAWMIWRGTKAKKEYVVRHKMEEHRKATETAEREEETLGNYRPERSTESKGAGAADFLVSPGQRGQPRGPWGRA